MSYINIGIVLINETTREKKEFKSINAAAKFLQTNFQSVQRAAIANGLRGGWRVFENAESIRKHIKVLEDQLKVVENR